MLKTKKLPPAVFEGSAGTKLVLHALQREGPHLSINRHQLSEGMPLSGYGLLPRHRVALMFEAVRMAKEEKVDVVMLEDSREPGDMAGWVFAFEMNDTFGNEQKAVDAVAKMKLALDFDNWVVKATRELFA